MTYRPSGEISKANQYAGPELFVSSNSNHRRNLDEERLHRVQSISRSFHLSPKDFCPNYPSHCYRLRAWCLLQASAMGSN